MKWLFVLFAAVYAGSTLAQGAPVVVPNTGEATYRYEFSLPRARGRFQPMLALTYSSNGGAGPYGYGWSLSGAYIERPTRKRDQFWLVQDGTRRLLVLVAQTASDKTYRPDVQSGFLELKTQNAADPTSWTATDAVGNAYAFTFKPGVDRWYLQAVTDVDQNTTTFSYLAEGGESALLASIIYNSYATNPPCPPNGGWCSPTSYDAAVTLTYGSNPHPITHVVAGSVVDRGSQLSTVTRSPCRRGPTSTARGWTWMATAGPISSGTAAGPETSRPPGQPR